MLSGQAAEEPRPSATGVYPSCQGDMGGEAGRSPPRPQGLGDDHVTAGSGLVFQPELPSAHGSRGSPRPLALPCGQSWGGRRWAPGPRWTHRTAAEAGTPPGRGQGSDLVGGHSGPWVREAKERTPPEVATPSSRGLQPSVPGASQMPHGTFPFPLPPGPLPRPGCCDQRGRGRGTSEEGPTGPWGSEGCRSGRGPWPCSMGRVLMVVLGCGSGFDPGAGFGVQPTLAEGRGQHV